MKTRAEIMQKLLELRQEKRNAATEHEETKCRAQMEILKWVLDEQI